MMKTYRIEFAGSAGYALCSILIITFLCFSVIGLPFAVAMFPTLYRIVEETKP
jgi:hypothetical protein